MKRLGHYTGKIYEDRFDIDNVKECCLVLSGFETKEEIDKLRLKFKLYCLECGGCPEAQNNWKIYEGGQDNDGE